MKFLDKFRITLLIIMLGYETPFVYSSNIDECPIMDPHMTFQLNDTSAIVQDGILSCGFAMSKEVCLMRCHMSEYCATVAVGTILQPNRTRECILSSVPFWSLNFTTYTSPHHEVYTDTDVCHSKPCHNWGVCRGKDTPICVCTSWWMGERCDVPSPCQNTECVQSNTEECTHNNTNYQCQCKIGYYGTFCEYVSCMDGINVACKPGYSGQYCEKDCLRCERGLCENGSTCANNTDSFTCECVNGTSGMYCQTQEPCFVNPCLNHGTCTETSGSEVCLCSVGYIGDTCEQDRGHVLSGDTLTITHVTECGAWNNIEYCPTASYVAGFRLQTDPADSLVGDASAVNSIEMVCKHVLTGDVLGMITSGLGHFGDWENYQYCTEGYFVDNMKLRMEYSNTGVNNVILQCKHMVQGDTQDIQGVGQTWGDWSPWSGQCSPDTAVCGLRTRIQPSQGIWADDKAMCDMQLVCCQY